MPVRVDLAGLRAIFASTKSENRSKIRQACAIIAAEVDDLFGDTAPTFMDLVDELLDGKATHEDKGAQYWYAIKEVAGTLGHWLNNSVWYPASADVFWSHASFRLYDIDTPMSVPSPDDSPTAFTLRKTAMTDELMAELKTLIADEEQFLPFSSWVADARRYNEDLLLFYH